MTVDKKEKSPRFAFLIPIFVGIASTHLQFSIHSGKHTIQKLQEILLLPTDKGQVNFRIFANLLSNP